jgi:peptidoglycan/xylan/chitin deacetylase (PgdA/CDA1 family)
MCKNQIRFPGDLKKAICITIDDGHISDYDLVSRLNGASIPATIFINKVVDHSDHLLSESKLIELSLKNEIGLHTKSHLSAKFTKANVWLEDLLENKVEIEQLLGKKVFGLALPFGHEPFFSKGLLRDAGLTYARTTRVEKHPFVFDPFSVPVSHCMDGWFDVSSIYDDSSRWPQARFLYGHSTDILDETVDEIVNLCNSRREEIWFCTLIEYIGWMQIKANTNVKGEIVN